MYTYNKLQSYRKVGAASASQLEQVSILLEHCAQLTMKVKEAAEHNQYEERFIQTERIMSIICNMQDAFDIENSEHACNMIQFLQNIIAALVQVNLKNEAELCTKIQQVLLDMAQAWRIADLKNREQSQSAIPVHKATSEPVTLSA